MTQAQLEEWQRSMQKIMAVKRNQEEKLKKDKNRERMVRITFLC